MNWYIVQAYSGFESKVADSIKDVMVKNSLEANFGEVLVPTHQVTEVKKGKRTQKQKKYFPGYVLVKLDLSKDIYHKIKNIQKVSGFLGPEGKPVPVSENEVKKIMNQLSETEANPSAGISFEIGEKVRVCDGPFASFNGLVEEIDEEKSRLKVSVSIFGRPTPVDLEFNQVEKN
jgi:transcriptional antiterminator NusG